MKKYIILIFFLLFFINACDLWYDELCKGACDCHINDYEKIYCKNNEKMMCNFNSKIEPVFEYFWNIGYDGKNCEEKGMICNKESDGNRVCTDLIEIGDKTDIIDGNDIIVTEELYYDRRCCIPKYMVRY